MLNPKDAFNIQHDGSIYREHIILFIDILGYKNLMLSNDEKRKAAIIEIQREVLESDKSGYSARQIIDEEGSTLNTKPITTLLSDTVVYSFPIESLEKCGHEHVFSGALNTLLNKIVDVQITILKQGLLTRGALTIGKNCEPQWNSIWGGPCTCRTA